MDGVTVSQETLAETNSSPRRYASPVRMRRTEVTERRLMDAAIAEMQRGNFHAAAHVVTSRAGFVPAALNGRFGSLKLFRHRLARERWETIASLAGIGHLLRAEQRRLVWLIVAGGPEPTLP